MQQRGARMRECTSVKGGEQECSQSARWAVVWPSRARATDMQLANSSYNSTGKKRTRADGPASGSGVEVLLSTTPIGIPNYIILLHSRPQFALPIYFPNCNRAS